MLKMLSNLHLANRMDFTAATDVLASGVQGSFVTIDANEKLQFATSEESRAAWPVWTESNRDGTAGFTPDTTTTGNLTVLDGYVRAITDQVNGYDALSIGDNLAVDTLGELQKTTTPSKQIAVVVKKHDSVTVLGTTYTDCVEFILK